MKLSAAQMVQMSNLLDEALDLDATERSHWLERLGGGHQDLVPALRQALAALDNRHTTEGGLGTLPKIDAADEPLAASQLEPGQRIGPYELIRMLGSGGMAEVWLARRADGAFKREIALKLPLVTRLRRDLEQRFARERDILAALEHPNIARLYDAGVDAQGLPYLAMEYVAGKSLTPWCDERRLGIRERLEIFLQVLDAVAYAHAHQVIHRDLKPSNILVDASGQVRLLDFGVAKLLEDESSEQVQLTQIYGRALTPEYASPEQLRGEPVDAASDIYSLGVLLYELLSGARPYGLKRGGSVYLQEQAMASAVLIGPSAVLTPETALARNQIVPRLARSLRGDLDAITFKALASKATQRYGSTAEFAQDLQRHLRGEPVRARPPALSYRLGRYIVRHRAGAYALLFGFLALTVAGGVQIAGSRHTASGERNGAAAPTVADPRMAGVNAGEKSIAVMPFADLSEGKNQAFLSDGLAEELIDQLARAPDLKVIARTSSFQFRNRNDDARSIGRELGVANLLEGSVRRNGNRLRVAVQLINAADGTYTWSQNYDIQMGEVYGLQSQIAQTVTRSLKVALDLGDAALGERAPDPRAYNLLLEANFYKGRHTRQDLQWAIETYGRALKIAPGYALAWARLGSAYWELANLSAAPAKEVVRARAALQRALRLNPKLMVAYFTVAGIAMGFDWDWTAAQKAIDRMRAIDPADRFLLPLINANMDSIFGRNRDAINTLRQLIERNPLDASEIAGLAALLYSEGRFDESLSANQRLLQLAPDYQGAHADAGLSQLALGRNDEALGTIGQESDPASRLSALAIAYFALGSQDRSDAALRQFQDSVGANAPYLAACVLAYRGELGPAMQQLELAWQHHDANLFAIKTDRLLSRLHPDPRFQALLARMQLDGDGPVPAAGRVLTPGSAPGAVR